MPPGAPIRGGYIHMGDLIRDIFDKADQAGIDIEQQKVADYVRKYWNFLEKQGFGSQQISLYISQWGFNQSGQLAFPSGQPINLNKGPGLPGAGGTTTDGIEYPVPIVTDKRGNTGYDTDGDGLVDVEADPASQTVTDSYSVQDYLGAVVGEYAINSELRDLAQKAAKQQWSMNEFQLALSRTSTYQERNEIAYQGMLQDLGLSGSNLNSLISQAVANNFSEGEFLFYLRKTPEYRERFRGIFDQNGIMRMSEQEYITFEKDLGYLGKKYGYNVTAVDIGQAIKKGFSADDFQDRLEALQRVNEYKPAMNALLETAKARGLVPKGKQFTRRELYDFVTGRASPVFYKLWEEAAAQTAARDAGFDVFTPKLGEKDTGQYTDLSRKLLRQVIQTLPGQQTEEQLAQPLSAVADEFLQLLPDARIQNMGLTKREIMTARFGGRNAAEIRQKIERIAKNAAAQAENELAAGPSYQAQGGDFATGGAALQRRVTE